MKLIKTAALLMSSYLLVACQAQEVEIKLSAEEIYAAYEGDTVSIDFEAKVGERYTQVDEEKRSTIESVTDKLVTHFPDADIEVDISSDEYEIEIEGQLIVAQRAPNSGAPYYIKVSESPITNFLLVTLEPSETYAKFAGALSDVNMMLKPDQFQGAKFKIKGSGEKIVFFGSYLSGNPTTIGSEMLSSKSVTVEMKEAIWQKTSVGFLIEKRN